MFRPNFPHMVQTWLLPGCDLSNVSIQELGYKPLLYKDDNVHFD